MESLTTEEKVKLSNTLIEKYRSTNAIKYKSQAWDIIRIDVAKLVNANFKGYPTAVKEDMLQSMALLLSNLMNSDSRFDPSRGVYILTYARKALIEEGRKCIDSTKTSMAYNRKAFIELKKAIDAKRREYPDATDDELLESLIREKMPNVKPDEIDQKMYQLRNLLLVHQGSVSLDVPIDDDGTTMSELVADDSNFVNDVHGDDFINSIIKIVNEMHEKKKLSQLEYQAVSCMISGKFKTSSDAARFLGKSRQNFIRAFQKGRSKIPEYIKNKYPDLWEYILDYFR